MVDKRKKDEEHWAAVMSNLDILFSKVDEIDKIQQRLEATFDMSTKVVEQMLKDQQTMVKKIENIGQARAQLTLQQMCAKDDQPVSPTSSDSTMDNPFQQGRPPEPRAQHFH